MGLERSEWEVLGVAYVSIMRKRGFMDVGEIQGGLDTDDAERRAEAVIVLKVESGNLPR
jgi:hypothetical protein